MSNRAKRSKPISTPYRAGQEFSDTEDWADEIIYTGQMASNNDDEKDGEASLQKSNDVTETTRSQDHKIKDMVKAEVEKTIKNNIKQCEGILTNQMVVWLNVITVVVCAMMCGYLCLNYPQDPVSPPTNGTTDLEDILIRLDSFEIKVDTFDIYVKTSKAQVTALEEKVNTINTKLRGKNDNSPLNIDIDELKSSIKDLILHNITQSVENKIEIESKCLNASIRHIDDKVRRRQKRHTKAILISFEKLQDLKNITDHVLPDLINTINIRISETNSKIKQTESSFKGQAETMIHETRILSKSVNTIHATIDDNLLPNKDTVKQTTVALLVIIGVVVILVMGLSNQINKLRGTSNEQPLPVAIDRNEKQKSQPPNPILKQLPANQTLETAICLLSFYEDSKEEHEALFRSIGLPERLLHHVTVKNHIIHRHEDIPRIPPSKLYFTFTNFTERHVIIEERGLGLGDLKRTTLDAIYKLKGSLVMVYVRDPGSRSIPDNTRFNRDIYCVTSQPELVLVNKMGRFFSVFDKLTDFQRKCLQNIIHDEFGL